MIKNSIVRIRDWGIYQSLLWFLWCSLLLTIPVTSFPWVPTLLRGSPVSPLAGIPLVLMVFLWLLPNLLRGGRIPVLAGPLFAFIGVALLATAIAPFLEIYPFLGRIPLQREVRALATLAAGVCFYLVASKFPQSDLNIRTSLRWLYLGAVLMLIWSSIQATHLPQSSNPVPPEMQNIHRIFCVRDMLRDRLTGFAYEPSWLANQLVVLYFPLWIASVVKGYSVFHSKLSRISVELVLLLWGSVILFLSFSRIGLLSFFATLGVLALWGAWNMAGHLIYLIRRRKLGQQVEIRIGTYRLVQVIVWVCLVFTFLAIMLAIVFVASQLDPRIASIFETDYWQIIKQYDEPVYVIASRLRSAERLIYWESAFKVFSLHPLLGVGLGNSGFFFNATVPSFGSLLPEIIRILNGAPQFPNPKNLWIRLLAETGIVGLLTFSVWLLVLFSAALILRRKGNDIRSMLGLAGLLALVAQLVEGFSLDTFALPQLWILVGLLTAAFSLRPIYGQWKDDLE